MKYVRFLWRYLRIKKLFYNDLLKDIGKIVAIKLEKTVPNNNQVVFRALLSVYYGFEMLKKFDSKITEKCYNETKIDFEELGKLFLKNKDELRDIMSWNVVQNIERLKEFIRDYN